MKFYTRKLIKPEALNANNTLFGGALLKWIDEEAGIYAMTKLNTQRVVTKYISEIDFVNSAHQGDVIEIGLKFLAIGTTSITFKCEVRNVFTKRTIISIDKIVFVKVNEEGLPTPHGVTQKEIEENSLVI